MQRQHKSAAFLSVGRTLWLFHSLHRYLSLVEKLAPALPGQQCYHLPRDWRLSVGQWMFAGLSRHCLAQINRWLGMPDGAGKVKDASAPGTGQSICDSMRLGRRARKKTKEHTAIYLGRRFCPNEICAKLNEIEN